MRDIYITALHLRQGGAENVIVSLANLFAEKGHRVTLLCTYHLGEPAYAVDSRVHIRYLTDKHPNREEFRAAVASKNPFRILKEGLYAVRTLAAKRCTMRRALAGISHGVVLATHHDHALLLSRYGKEGVGKIAQLHHDHGFDRALLRDYAHRFGRIDRLVVLTPQLREELAAHIAPHNTHTRCVTVPNFYTVAAEPAQKAHRVVAVGRLHREKGFDRLLDIWAATRRGDWTLTLVGGGDEQAALQAQAAALGVADTVTFTGMLPYADTLAHIRQAGILAMTSRTESFGLVLLEGMVCRTPPVAFDVRTGPAAIIRDGEDGFLVPDGDTAAFARRLEQLMEDDTLRQQMGERAAEHVQRFSRERVAAQWDALLNEFA